MALIQIATNTVTSATSAVTLTGISDDSVYVVTILGAKCDTDAQGIRARVTTSGTPDTDSEYDLAAKEFKTTTSFGNSSAANQDNWFLQTIGTPTNEQYNGIHYLYNFANSSEFSFISAESCFLDLTPNLIGFQGGYAHTVASASDGVSFEMESAVNMNTGATFTLYKVI